MSYLSPIDQIANERERQDILWGNNPHTQGEWAELIHKHEGIVLHKQSALSLRMQFPVPWTTIEICKEELNNELVQLAALCVAWLEQNLQEGS